MKYSILASRRQKAIDSIGGHAERLSGDTLDLRTGIKGNVEHRQLFMLERIAAFMEELQPESGDSGVSVDDILELDISKTSKKVIAAEYGS